MSSIYAVIDTNVVVSSLLSKELSSNPSKIMMAVLDGTIIPIFCDEIIEEYQSVLSYSKFHFSEEKVKDILDLIRFYGLDVERTKTEELFIDPDNLVFYEVSLSIEGSFLITGNKKHFPVKPTIVSPAEFVKLLKL